MGKKAIAAKFFVHPNDLPKFKEVRDDHMERPRNIEK